MLNGRPLDPAIVYDGQRIALPELSAENTLSIVASGAYSRTGEGLHRFEDPADGLVYIYSQSFLYDAHRMFACFDQPDLKAPFTLHVTAPPGWTVIANAPGVESRPGRWVFEPTLPIATYATAIVAGPYHAERCEHDGIPLGVYCRQSLAPFLMADDVFEVTKATFDHYHRLFGIRYPFGKYDQVFAPEFNAGAMENVGCVTFGERFIFRSRVTDGLRELRAKVIAHEMAHMWLGNLVTMRWWDDIWLNESFADYLAHEALVKATRFTDAWATFCARGKQRGYDQDQRPTTHPVADTVTDTAAALQNFDGISYIKGASVLRQLAAWVGQEAFDRGLRTYLEAHRFANVTLADLVDALELAGEQDLGEWVAGWLRTSGLDLMRLEIVEAPDERYASVTVVRTAFPDGQPVHRPHRIGIGIYQRVGERLVRRDRIAVDIINGRTEIASLVGATRVDLLLLNDDDLSWTKIRFDPHSLRTLLEGGISRLESLMARAVTWSALWDMTRDGELPAGTFVRLVLGSLPSESDVGLFEQLLSWVRQAIDDLGQVVLRPQRQISLATVARRIAVERQAEPDIQHAGARAYVAAAGHGDAAVLSSWLDGNDIPTGLFIDHDLRWLIVNRLAVLGEVGRDRIAQEAELDRTSAGQASASEALASLPTAGDKAAAWSALIDDTGLSNRLIEATARGFWHHDQADVGRPYIDRYFDALPTIWRQRTLEMALMITRLMFPAVIVEPATLTRTDEALADPRLEPGLRRVLQERRDDLRRALASREHDIP